VSKDKEDQKGRGMQKLIFDIFKEEYASHKNIVTRSYLLEILMSTSLKKKGKAKVSYMLDQALMHLKKKGKIKKLKKYGRWSLSDSEKGERKKYVPKVCRGLEEHNQRANWCPVREMYIGNPVRQCELLHGTDYAKLGKIKYPKEGELKRVDPMKFCYFERKPNKIQKEAKRVLYLKKEQEIEEAKRRILSSRGY